MRADALLPLARAPIVSASPQARLTETEDVGTLDLDSVEEEANRCLSCACVAVNVSDLAPALMALGAKIRTTKRVIAADNFFAVGTASTTVLDADELVTELEIPLPQEANIQRYRKFRTRRSIDFAIVSVASVLTLATTGLKRLPLFWARSLPSLFV